MEASDKGAPSGAHGVIDLAAYRARLRPRRLPEAVRDEMAAADRLFEQLRATGQEVRFELPEDGGHVRAELRGVGGGVVRRLPLATVVVGGDVDPPPAVA